MLQSLLHRGAALRNRTDLGPRRGSSARGGTPRRASLLVGAVLAAGIVAGCSSPGGGAGEGPERTEPTLAASSSEWDPHSWQPTVRVEPVVMTESDKEKAYQEVTQRRAEELEIQPPTVQRVAWMANQADYDRAQATCLQEAGFPVRTNPTGGLAFDEDIPDAQTAAFDLAMYRCDALYPLDPTRQQEWSTDQLGLIYDYWDQYYIPCMRANGHQVDTSQQPSRAAYIAAFHTPERLNWWPSRASEELREEEQERLLGLCPPLASRRRDVRTDQVSHAGQGSLRASRSPGWIRWVVLLAVVLLVGGAAFWAGRVTLTPQDQTAADSAPTSTVEVVEQELGRVITVTTSVSREQTPVAFNALTGVVTQTSASGELAAGTVLYTVGQTPVVLVQGEVPFWRALGPGLRGEDVRQLQSLLVDQGAGITASGVWDQPTERAWTSWLQDQGYPGADEVPLGQLVAVESLPAGIVVDQTTARKGVTLSGGEEIVSAAGTEPVFAMELTQSQAQMIPPGTAVTVHHADGAWPGVTVESQVSSEGQILVGVTSPEGGLVCADECGLLPAEEVTQLLTDVNVVSPQKGPVVPVAAITTAADGTSSVLVGPAGAPQRRDVRILAVADGLAVVEGVEVGESVQVLGGEQQ